MVNYNDGNWHGWNGGESPVHPKSQVEIVWQSAENEYHLDLRRDTAVSLCSEGNVFGRVIAFRVVKEHREPKKRWFIEYRHGAFMKNTREEAEDVAKNYAEATMYEMTEILR